MEHVPVQFNGIGGYHSPLLRQREVCSVMMLPVPNVKPGMQKYVTDSPNGNDSYDFSVSTREFLPSCGLCVHVISKKASIEMISAYSFIQSVCHLNFYQQKLYGFLYL